MANAALMKKSNRLSILRAVREGDISRAELARRTGLTRAAVTLLVDGLIGEGLLAEGVAVRSDKGRRPTMLSLGDGGGLAIGIDLSREACALRYAISKCACFAKYHSIVISLASRYCHRSRMLSIPISGAGEFSA